jgi:MFS family permease
MSDDASQGQQAEIRRLKPLRQNHDYILLWSGQMVSTLGSGVSQLAFPLLILAITHSPAQAGFAGFLYSLPYVILSLPAGALVDRWDRKRVMILCDMGRALNAASIPLAAALWHLTIQQLFITTTIEGTLFTFFNIAEVACLPRVVPKEQIPAAAAQNEGGSIATSLIAPSIGGLLYQFSRTVPFVLDAVSYAVSVFSLTFIKTEFQGERSARTGTLRADIMEGIAWLWRQPLIRFMAFLTGGLNFCNSATGLVLIVVAKNQHAPAAAIGIIFSIGSVGGILGAMIAPRIQKRYSFGRVITLCVWAEAILWPLYAVAPNIVALGVVAACLFFLGPIYNAVQFGYRVSIIPDALQGRVNSAFRLLAFGFIPLGTALSGILLQSVGTTSTILIFSVVALALALASTINRNIRNAGAITQPQAV